MQSKRARASRLVEFVHNRLQMFSRRQCRNVSGDVKHVRNEQENNERLQSNHAERFFLKDNSSPVIVNVLYIRAELDAPVPEWQTENRCRVYHIDVHEPGCDGAEFVRDEMAGTIGDAHNSRRINEQSTIDSKMSEHRSKFNESRVQQQ